MSPVTEIITTLYRMCKIHQQQVYLSGDSNKNGV